MQRADQPERAGFVLRLCAHGFCPWEILSAWCGWFHRALTHSGEPGIRGTVLPSRKSTGDKTTVMFSMPVSAASTKSLPRASSPIARQPTERVAMNHDVAAQFGALLLRRLLAIKRAGITDAHREMVAAVRSTIRSHKSSRHLPIALAQFRLATPLAANTGYARTNLKPFVPCRGKSRQLLLLQSRRRRVVWVIGNAGALKVRFQTCARHLAILLQSVGDRLSDATALVVVTGAALNGCLLAIVKIIPITPSSFENCFIWRSPRRHQGTAAWLCFRRPPQQFKARPSPHGRLLSDRQHRKTHSPDQTPEQSCFPLRPSSGFG